MEGLGRFIETPVLVCVLSKNNRLLVMVILEKCEVQLKEDEMNGNKITVAVLLVACLTLPVHADDFDGIEPIIAGRANSLVF
jgi:hypothetical protein